jgi:hypothetical protein
MDFTKCSPKMLAWIFRSSKIVKGQIGDLAGSWLGSRTEKLGALVDQRELEWEPALNRKLVDSE